MANRVKIFLGIILLVVLSGYAVHKLRNFNVCYAGSKELCVLQLRVSELANGVEAADVALRQIVRLDSLNRAIPPSAGVFALLPSVMSDSTRSALRDTVMAAFGDSIPLKAAVGVVTFDYLYGSSPSYPYPRNSGPNTAKRAEIYTGVSSKVPFCVTVLLTDSTPSYDVDALARFAWLNTSRSGSLTGVCYYWGRYGAPGSRVDEWLRSGGYRFATMRSTHSIQQLVSPTRRPFRPSYRLAGNGSVHALRCIAGDLESCQNAVLDSMARLRRSRSPINYNSPVAFQYERYDRNFYSFGGADPVLLAELERYYGPERFEKFWTSGLEVEGAFEAAFGKPLATWTMEWAQSRLNARPASTRLDIQTLLLSLVAVAIFAGASVSVLERRQVL